MSPNRIIQWIKNRGDISYNSRTEVNYNNTDFLILTKGKTHQKEIYCKAVFKASQFNIAFVVQCEK